MLGACRGCTDAVKGEQSALPCCVPWPWVHSELGFQEEGFGEDLFALVPLLWREASGLALHSSICHGPGALNHLPVPKAPKGSGQSSP